MPDIEELKRAKDEALCVLSEARQTLFVAENAMFRKIERRVEVQRAIIRDMVEEEDVPELERLRDAAGDAFFAHRDAEKAWVEAVKAAHATQPTGMFVEWKSPQYSGTLYKTGRTGIVEVRTTDSKFPGRNRWRLPPLGGEFIRVLKKDGSPGLNFDLISSFGWHPDGVDPNKKGQ
jgi:hypothetical protein